MSRRLFRSVAERLFPKSLRRFRGMRAARAERRHWDERIKDVLMCADNARLPRVQNAGEIEGNFQVMHNGLRVIVDGYYGEGITRMLAANRGCHEPQEEVIFDLVARTLPDDAVMIEAGAYWGFYSMWFQQIVPSAKVYLIEPAAENLKIGELNFKENHCAGDFTRAYVGAKAGVHSDGTQILDIVTFAKGRGLQHVDLLHADVQGSEMEMLLGASALIEARAVDYLFISTHSMELHDQCAAFLENFGYRILVSVDMDETYSADGILVACSPKVSPPIFEPPSVKVRSRRSKE